VEVDAQPLTFRASSRCRIGGGSRGCSALSSTLADQVHVAVAVKVRDQDHDQVNRDPEMGTPDVTAGLGPLRDSNDPSTPLVPPNRTSTARRPPPAALGVSRATRRRAPA
jgi:hypothetical protein